MPKGFAVIGVGTWGQLHAEVYASHPEAQLVAVCDADGEKAHAIARRYGCKACTDIAEITQDRSVDAVSVATPDFAHTKPSLAVLSAGKHLLVEKPLATTVPDAKRIAEAARTSGLKVMVDFHNRWNPLFYQVKESFRRGELGKPVHLYIRHSNTTAVPRQMLGWSRQSSVAWFLGSHSVDLARWLVGAEVERVYTVSRNMWLKKLGVDSPDFFVTTLEFTGGAVALVENSWMLPESMPTAGNFEAEVVGTGGCAFVDFTMHRAVDIYHNRHILPDVLAGYEQYGKTAGFTVESIKHFIECVVCDRYPVVTVEDGLAVTKIISAALESAKRGAPVNLS
ncbi:MAG TPA: Gfo/Idh/MocA family oxidoreductase [Firmicutes bacterium]|nr:Gfo/Idh/MocA family oxidoreductase [Bacillota bacterium]